MSGPRASLTDDQFARIARLVHDRCGFVLRAEQRPTLERHLGVRLEASGAATAAAYLARIEAPDGGGPEFRELVEGVLVQETFFLRTPAHFQALRERVVPALLARPAMRASGRTLSVWCAGCATGPEAYSAAIALLESEAADRFSLLATDISGRALEEARCGAYHGRALRPVPEPLLERYFVPHGDGMRVRDEVRARVQFKTHNLTGDPFPSGVDVIFCRNVLIYFPADVRAAVVEQAHEALTDKGVMFVGPSETLSDFSDRFERVWYDRTFAFVRRAPGARPAVAREGTRVPRRKTPVSLPSPAGGAQWRPLGRRATPAEPAPLPPVDVVELAGPLDEAHAAAATELLKRRLADLDAARPARVVLDLSRVSFLDASGVRLLSRAARLVRDHGGRSGFVCAAPSVRRWLEREAERGALDLFDTVAQAREALER